MLGDHTIRVSGTLDFGKFKLQLRVMKFWNEDYADNQPMLSRNAKF